MRIAGAALNQIPFDWQNNLRNIEEAIKQAKAQGVELLAISVGEEAIQARLDGRYCVVCGLGIRSPHIRTAFPAA